jgi:hypothetical protein
VVSSDGESFCGAPCFVVGGGVDDGEGGEVVTDLRGDGAGGALVAGECC